MSFLSDLLLELVAGIGPSDDRGFVAGFTFISVVCLSLSLWVGFTSSKPLSEPWWGVGALGGSIVIGAAGVLVSMLHFQRNPSERTFATVCLISNAAAVVGPLLVLAA